MSRNKYPEETHERIVQAATELFLMQGYDKTSLQDIIDQLGGLTKGAIYHHFKSKEEILLAVVEHIADVNTVKMKQILEDETLDGKTKLEKMFSVSIDNSSQEKVFAITPNLLDNPSFFTYYIKIIIYDTVPNYIIPIVKQGVSDGSIKTKYPEELAEVIIFLSDIWMNPLVFPMNDTEIIRRAELINQMLEPFGIRLFDDKIKSGLSKYRRIIEERTK